MMTHGQLVDGVRVRASIERLARWWTQASNEERFALLRRSIANEEGAPSLGDLQIAQFVAEASQGEIGEG